MIKLYRTAVFAALFTLLTASSGFAQTACTVTFFLDDAVELGAISYDVEYDPLRVEFDGNEDQVSCSSLVEDTLPSFYDDEPNTTVNAALIGFGTTFTGPRPLTICDITTGTTPVGGDFVITVTDASDAGGSPVSPLPTMSVSGINCSGTTTTTTTSTSTTTTLEGASTTTTTTLPGDVCDVTFRLFNYVEIGALQYEVDYSQMGGDFLGSGTGVDCTRLVDQTLGSHADDDAGRTLRVGYISSQGFQGPIDLTVCTFVSTQVDLLPEDFPVTVTDASDPSSQPVNAFVFASEVFCASDTTTTTTSTSTTTTTLSFCGDGFIDAGEECDDASSNSDTEPDACRTNCLLPMCGDAVLDSFEECDEGVANADVSGATCFADCTMPAICGDADAGGNISAGDALLVLQRAVGQPVTCPKHRCDGDGSGVLTASDAQRVLKGAVGQQVTLDCALDVKIMLDDTAEYGSIDISIDYATAGDAFVGEGVEAACADSLGGAVTAVFNNDTSGASLSIVLSSGTSFAGPVELAVCDFFNRGDAPSESDFSIQVLSATDGLGNPVAAPLVSIAY